MTWTMCEAIQTDLFASLKGINKSSFLTHCCQLNVVYCAWKIDTVLIWPMSHHCKVYIKRLKYCFFLYSSSGRHLVICICVLFNDSHPSPKCSVKLVSTQPVFLMLSLPVEVL